MVRWTSTLPRVLIEDVREDGSFMRVTVHEDSGVIVFSHWLGEMCVAATRVPATAIPELITLLEEAIESS